MSHAIRRSSNTILLSHAACIWMLLALGGCTRATTTYNEPGVKDLPEQERARICGPMYSRLRSYDDHRIAGNYRDWNIWVKPGPHSVTVQYFRPETTPSGSSIIVFSEDTKTLSLDAEPGHTYQVTATSEAGTRMVNRFLLAYGERQPSQRIPIAEWQAEVVDVTGNERQCRGFD